MNHSVGTDKTWLAVLDGRFLPVLEFSIQKERDTVNVQGMNSFTSKKSIPTASMITGTVTTRRDPHIRPRHSILQVFTDVRKITVDNLQVRYDEEWNPRMEEFIHMIEFSASNWTETTRK